MKQQEQLNAVRQQWYQAYLAGDLVTLKAIELEGFTYISTLGIEDTSRRYQLISQRLDVGTWFPSTAYRDDVTTQYQFLADTCYVTGEGRVVSAPGVSHNRYMSELWQQTDAGWRILSLHASVVPDT
ncbi:MAG: nuclear transport factor 2 family protein [Gammaproteobacteria bacterium]|nr:nuclear transport factor 2 family protein [Gammaproteobacteria bacterium]